MTATSWLQKIGLTARELTVIIIIVLNTVVILAGRQSLLNQEETLRRLQAQNCVVLR